MNNRDITIIAIGLYIILLATLIGILVFTPPNNYDINKDGKVDTLDLLLLKKEILRRKINMIDLRLGDCLDVMKTIPDNSIDCIITSPPYWKGFEYEAYFNSYKQYLDWCKKWLRECKRILANNGTFYLNVINDSEITIRAFEIMEIATRDIMFKLHDTIIWYRYNQQPANTTRQLTNQCEYIFMLRNTSANIFLDKNTAYGKNPLIFKTKNVGNVWELPFNSGKQSNTGFGRKETKSKYGHSGFPIQLPETCILLSTNENDTVLDCFMGSGTTGVACKQLNRNFIGIELDKTYFNLAKERIENTKIQESLILNEGDK